QTPNPKPQTPNPKPQTPFFGRQPNIKMKTLNSVMTGGSLSSYMVKAKFLEEAFRSANKRGQEELQHERDHVQFLENCLDFLSEYKESLKKKIMPGRVS